MSDQEVKGKKNGRGRGKNKLSASSLTSSSGNKDTEKNNGSNQQSAGGGDGISKKSGTKKKGSTSKGLKLARGRGRIRIEDSSSDEEIVPKVEVKNSFEKKDFPIEVKPLISSKLEEKVSDENYINRTIKTEKFNFPEVNSLSLIHTTQTSSLIFKSDLDDDIVPSLSFVGPRMNIPLHNNKPLAWNHKVNLIGDKCPSPRIHICERCERPILLYGRLIPCKHVFCYDCAKANLGCLRCTDKVFRVEKNKLGTVFMCTYENCRRTYLSHRDLQAHVAHRHAKRSSNQPPSSKQSPQIASTQSSSLTLMASPSSSMKAHQFSSSRNKTNTLSGNNFTQISSRATSSTIPMSIHDDPMSNERKHHHNHHQSYLNSHHTINSSSSSSSSSKTKLPSNKNLVISGKSPNLTSQLLVNLPRNSWSTSGQPSSTISSASSSFISPTSLTTSSWNLPLLSDPRQSTAINRHFYQ